MDLETPVGELPFVGPVYVSRLKKLGIETVNDLFHHIPSRYLDFRNATPIGQTNVGEVVAVEGEVTGFVNQYSKQGRKIQIANIRDDSGDIQAIWFNQPFLIGTFRKGTRVSLAGEVSWFARKKALISPEYEKIGIEGPIHTRGLIPVYPLTSGLSSKWIRRRITDAWQKTVVEEYLPKEILEKYQLDELAKAIQALHFPKLPNDYFNGRKRLAFDELLFLQLRNLRRKSDWNKNKASSKLKIESEKLKDFISSLPFELTKSQQKAVSEILKDLEKEIPMNRLLEGDVGSGKTVVAAIAAFASHQNGFQSIFLAPTQILAEQHFTTLTKLFAKHDIKISLITGATPQAAHAGGQAADIYVGTHALIHRDVDMKRVAFVVIDEQHRFGVEQRTHLVRKAGKKNVAPHILTMTATPIPRTIALTMYGDLALSVLDELPKERQPITTWIVEPAKRDGGYEWMDIQIEKEKIQVYVICPLIEESEAEGFEEIKSVKSEYEKLKKIFPKRKLGLLHGKLKPKEKTEVLEKFKKGEFDILVATPVVEVGIDVANATIIMIEAAERFGLAQLHQLRGRVGRGKKKSYCLLMIESKSPISTRRLQALKETNSGFKLAELDLKLRGPGEVFGKAQSGFAELTIARWQDVELIQASREAAKELVGKIKIKDIKEVIPN